MEIELVGIVASVSTLPLHTGVAGSTSGFPHFGRSGKSFSFEIGVAGFLQGRLFTVFRLAILMATPLKLDSFIIDFKVRLSSPAAMSVSLSSALKPKAEVRPQQPEN